MPPIESFSTEARTIHTELRTLNTTLTTAAPGAVTLDITPLQTAIRAARVPANEPLNRRSNASVLGLLRALSGNDALTLDDAVNPANNSVVIAAADREAKSKAVADFLASIPTQEAAKADAETLHKQVRDALTTLQRTVATDVEGRKKSFEDFITALRGLEERHAPSDIYIPLRDRLRALYPGADAAASLATFVETAGRDQAALRTLAGELGPGDYPAGMSPLDRTALQLTNAIDGYVANAMVGASPQALQIAQLFFGGSTPQETGRNIAAFFRWMVADTLAGITPDPTMPSLRPLYERAYSMAEALHWQTAKEEYGRANPGAVTTPPATPLPAVRDPVTGAMVVPPSPEPSPVITIPNEAVVRGRWTECYRIMWRSRRANTRNVPDMPNLVQLSAPDGETVAKQYVEQVQKLAAPSGAPSTVPTTPEQRVKRMTDFFAAGDPHNVTLPYAADRHLISNNNTRVSFYKTGAVLYVRLGDREVRVQTPAPNTDANAISLTKPVAPDNNPDNVIIKINGTATGVKLGDLVTHLQLGTNTSNTHVMITPNNAAAGAITSRVEAGADTPETRMNAFFASGVNQNIVDAYNAGRFLLMADGTRTYFYKDGATLYIRLNDRIVRIQTPGAPDVDANALTVRKGADNNPANVLLVLNGSATGVKLSDVLAQLTQAGNTDHTHVMILPNGTLPANITSREEALTPEARLNRYFTAGANRDITTDYNAGDFILLPGDVQAFLYKKPDNTFWIRLDGREVKIMARPAAGGARVEATALRLSKVDNVPGNVVVKVNALARGVKLSDIVTDLTRASALTDNIVGLKENSNDATDISTHREYTEAQRTARMNDYFGAPANKEINAAYDADEYVISENDEHINFHKEPDGKFYVRIDDRIVQIETPVAPPITSLTLTKPGAPGTDPELIKIRINGDADGITLGMLRTNLNNSANVLNNRVTIAVGGTDAADIVSRAEYTAPERLARLNAFFGADASKDITNSYDENVMLITSGNKHVFFCKRADDKFYLYLNDRRILVETQPANDAATALKVVRAADNPDNAVLAVNAAGDTGVTLASVVAHLEANPTHNRVAIKPNAADAVTSREIP